MPAHRAPSCRRSRESSAQSRAAPSRGDAAPQRIGKARHRQRPDVGEPRQVGDFAGHDEHRRLQFVHRAGETTRSRTFASARRSAVAISHSARSTARMARAGLLRRRASSARRTPRSAWKNGTMPAPGTSPSRAPSSRSRPCPAGSVRPSAARCRRPRDPSAVARHDRVAASADRDEERGTGPPGVGQAGGEADLVDEPLRGARRRHRARRIAAPVMVPMNLDVFRQGLTRRHPQWSHHAVAVVESWPARATTLARRAIIPAWNRTG